MSLKPFTYEVRGQTVVFGAGSIKRISSEAERLGISRALVVSSTGRKQQAGEIAVLLGARCAGLCDAATRNVPAPAFEKARQAVAANKADGLVVLGGGSAQGLGKALALDLGLPFIAVVTTYSGSEMAANWKVGSGDRVRAGKDARALPAIVIYDPVLTLDLPPALSAASGMNAMAHAVESLYGPTANPVCDHISEESIRLLGATLPRVVRDSRDLDARTECLYGAWLAAAFRGGAAISHQIARSVRQLFDLNHAQTHTVVLPYAVAFNRAAAPEAMERIERALGCADAASGLFDLSGSLGLKRSFRELGLSASDLDRASDAIMSRDFFNPRPAGRHEVRALVQEIYDGERPAP